MDNWYNYIMNISVKPGKHVVAVSGGVDSMVLLHMLHAMPGLQLIVAHFDHGIRADSAADRNLVEQTAHQYNLPFVYEGAELGTGASEATARQARYDFLERVRQQNNADAIITAHHQDDLIETAIINMLRGTGRKGLSSLASAGDLLRPLLDSTKQEMYDYAKEHQLEWHEDSTNTADDYLRNYIRHHLLPRFTAAERDKLLAYIKKAQATNPLIDELLLQTMGLDISKKVDRGQFIMLPFDVSCELMAVWLREQGCRQFDRKLINRATVQAKVAQSGKIIDLTAGYQLKVGKTKLQITHGSLVKTL
jgi:tRNA(Ile)-lysidine synthetase-like protein